MQNDNFSILQYPEFRDQQRTLRHKEFETLNGLPFVATDTAIHRLLESHTMEEAESLQLALGLLRRAQGHYKGNYVLIDPHCTADSIAAMWKVLMEPQSNSPARVQ